MKFAPDEPEWLKRTLLQTAGIELSFPTFTIVGINGEEISDITHNTMQTSKVLDYYINITTEDEIRFSITKNDVFYRYVAGSKIRYDITGAIRDVYGWTQLRCKAMVEYDIPVVPGIMPPNITYPL